MRYAILLAASALIASLSAQQPNPRQQPGAMITSFAPEQHDLYDGRFVLSANRIYMVGTLTPGKEADVIMLRTDRINVLPINDPIGVVVRGIDSSNVDSVFIAGKARKRHGQLIDVDLNRVRRMAYESRDYVVAASGFTLPAI